MSNKFSARVLVTLTLIGLGLFCLAMPSLVNAQCGSIDSGCVKCHQATQPVYGTTAWHSEYGHRQACWNCHGGNDTATDEASAHVGLVRNPLDDAYASCYACHPDNYEQLAQRYAQSMGVAISVRQPAPPAGELLVSHVTQPIVIPSTDPTTVATHAFDWMWLLGFVPVLVAGALAWFVWKKRKSTTTA